MKGNQLSHYTTCRFCHIVINYGKSSYHEEFPVIDIEHSVPNVFGIESCLKLYLIHKGPTLAVNNREHKIVIDKSEPPVVNPPRKIPVAIKANVKSELDRMEKLNIIEKQTKANGSTLL